MSIPAQGAVGAETMTTDWRDLLATAAAALDDCDALFCAIRSDWSDPRSECREGCAKAEQGKLAIFNAIAALASPLADSDERTAGGWRHEMRPALDLIAERLACVDHSLFDIRHDEKVVHPISHRVLRELMIAAFDSGLETQRRMSATPAQPAGAVPDSLRALSEAAYPGPWIDDEDDIIGAQDADRSWGGGDIICDMPSEGEDSREHWPQNRAFIIAAANFVREQIATHPAGQSAGSGAEADIELGGAAGSNLAPWLLSGTDEEVIEQLMRRSAGDVACLFFPTPHNVVDPIRRSYHTGRPPRQQRLLAALLRRLTPSPVNAAALVDQIARCAFYSVGVPNNCNRQLAEALIAGPLAPLLAARPAAPEAQGAWCFDMDAAPRDGRPVDLWVFFPEHDKERRVADAKWIDGDWFFGEFWRQQYLHMPEVRAWCLPAPPASSGQGGR